jgi:hypothetical protein
VSTVHVVPTNDLVEHETTESCACGPTCEVVFRGDGTNGWLYTHHSLDGRERRETRDRREVGSDDFLAVIELICVFAATFSGCLLLLLFAAQAVI